ncbi:MAG: AMP-binding protein [Janthinobacterium lividum]
MTRPITQEGGDARPFAWEASYPPGLAWDAPLRVSTLPAMLDRAVADYADRPAITYRATTLSFAALGSLVDRLARGLHAAGVRRGDAVGLLLGNTPAHPVAFFAVLKLGGIVVHLTPLDPARALAAKLADAGAATLITTNLPGVLPQALAAGAARLVVADDAAWGPGAETLPMPPGALVMGALEGPALDWPVLDPQAVALLQFTGGTTGQPRAAQLTHANLTSTVSIYDVWNQGFGRGFQAGDRVLCVLPLFHIYALTAVLLRALSNGVELVLRSRFVLDQVLDDIKTGRCTQMNGVPTMWIAMVNAPGIERRDLGSLRVASSGGAALPHEVGERFFALTGLRLGGGWGMTETSPAGTNLLPERASVPGEIGVPLPGVEMQVVALDDPRRVLPAGEAGEIRVRGPNVTPGYWRRPAENAQAFVDGWFLTGDIGRMEPDGRFVLMDRKKDMIISGGFNVYPRAIEEAIHEHPDVREAAVIGVADAYRGQAAKAFVVLREGAAALELDGLRAFLAERLGKHELPALLEVRDSLPHTPVGKLAKRELIAEQE